MRSETSLKNDYALVTGASDGLGREFAIQLASMGMSLVLVARSEEGLNETARLLKLASHQKVLVLTADLTDPAAFGRIREFLARNSVRIKLLVNNAGSGGWGRFEDMTSDLYSKMIDLNVKAPVLLSELLFDELSSQPGSAMINVSSLAAIQPVPYMSVYAATKSFMTHFSLGLWNEWEKRGVYIQTLMPGAIATRFDDKNGGFKAPFPKDQVGDIVKMSLTELTTRRRPIVYAKRSWSQRAFRMWLPLPFLVREVGKVFSPQRSK
jgi:short-subunit dehydrogenase